MTGGELLGIDASFESVSIDSRSCHDALFVAIKGDRHDGHDFLEKAFEGGASACVVERDLEPGLSGLKVKDCREALGWAGAMNRKAFKGKVIALTGSSGKTTTKNMLTAILNQVGKTCSTAANQNNEIGVPLTLLAIPRDADFVVVEMGARHLGDIEYLGRFVAPDVAMVVNAGSAHIGEFGGYENIVKAKGEIYGTIIDGGTAVINNDDPACDVWLQGIDAKPVIGFSLATEMTEGHDDLLRVDDIQLGVSESVFSLCYQGETASVKLNAAGEHNIQSAAAASAAALACDIELPVIARGLSSLTTQDTRLQSTVLADGSVLLDDSYNANPASMKAAINVLAMQPGKKFAALGEMGELGAQSESMHIEIAEHARDKGVDALFLIGPHAEVMAASFGEGAVAVPSMEAMKELVKNRLDEGVRLLVKGSRSAGMEQLVIALKEGCN